MRLGSFGGGRGGGVLSVAKLTLGQEAYYEQQVVRGLDDYYAGRGESPGLWAGSGAASGGSREDDECHDDMRHAHPTRDGYSHSHGRA